MTGAINSLCTHRRLDFFHLQILPTNDAYIWLILLESILESCSRALYGIRTLRAHGMQKECLHEVFRSTILARLTYASPAWSSFCSTDDIKKFDSFVNKSKKSDYYNPKSPAVKQLFAEADTSLFKSVLTNRNHLLYPLLVLPAAKTQHYELRTRPHNLTLTRKSCHYDNCNNDNFCV